MIAGTDTYCKSNGLNTHVSRARSVCWHISQTQLTASQLSGFLNLVRRHLEILLGRGARLSQDLYRNRTTKTQKYSYTYAPRTGFEPTFLRHDLENFSTFEDRILRRCLITQWRSVVSQKYGIIDRKHTLQLGSVLKFKYWQPSPLAW